MPTSVRQEIRLGDLVVAAFDEAAQCRSNPHEVSGLAAATVMHILRRSRRSLIPAAQTPLPARAWSKQTGDEAQ